MSFAWKNKKLPNDSGRKDAAAGLSELHNLLRALDKINSLCIGEIAMGCKLDAQHIGELIYEATGMNAEELTKHCKSVAEKSELQALLELHSVKLPPWAAWAVVNSIGDLWVYEYPPTREHYGWRSPDGEESCVLEGVGSTIIDEVLIRI